MPPGTPPALIARCSNRSRAETQWLGPAIGRAYSFGPGFARPVESAARRGGCEKLTEVHRLTDARKNFVLDTNVLLHDPRSIFRFDDNNVIIPIYVIEEIDQFKTRSLRARPQRAPGRALPRRVPRRRARSPRACRCRTAARCASRFTDQRAAAVDGGRAADGQPHPRGRASTLTEKEPDTPDRLRHQGHQPPHPRRRARPRRRGLRAPSASRSPSSTPASPSCSVPARARRPDVQAGRRGRAARAGRAARPTSSCCSRTRPTRRTPRWAASTARKGKVVPLLRTSKEGVWGIRPRNKEQSFALDLLLDDDIKLVTLVGKAGTGKTLLAHRRGPAEGRPRRALYQKLLVSRPDLAARPRHRLPARRRRGEAQPVDAAHLRQRRVPAEPQSRADKKAGPRATTS